MLQVTTSKLRASMTNSELIAAAKSLAGEFRTSRKCVAGDVAAALQTAADHVYTGICIDTSCGLGFCAEHAAVAEMLKARESHIIAIVAVDGAGTILPPCGRCRELLWQVDARNGSTRVIVAPGQAVSLKELLPYQYQAAAIVRGGP
jgi:cytidine deaminase